MYDSGIRGNNSFHYKLFSNSSVLPVLEWNHHNLPSLELIR